MKSALSNIDVRQTQNAVHDCITPCEIEQLDVEYSEKTAFHL